MLNLHFKASQALGPFPFDSPCRKKPACKIWWVLVRSASSYGQNTFFDYFFRDCLKESFKNICFGFPKAFKPFPSEFFVSKLHTEHIEYSYMSIKHHFRQLNFSGFFWTTDGEKQQIYNSQYLACLLLFN